MIREYAATRRELIQYILSSRSRMMGSANREGALYHEIPFPGYESLPVRRSHSKKRVQLITGQLDLAGKSVLDIGCNIGYFCFEFARLGATCWGFDYDQDAIFIAQSLKHIHRVEDVRFFHRGFSEETISFLVEQEMKFDVILLNSVIHWLLYDHFSSLRSVAVLLNRLITSSIQYIVYEPSSSDSAYYPEVLGEKGVKEFFRLLGVGSYRKIGSAVASNVGTARNIWLGKRDIYASVQKVNKWISRGLPDVRDSEVPIRIVHAKRDKVCLQYGSLFIKTILTEDSNHNFLLRNELAAVRHLARYAEHLPVLIAGVELGKRVYLVYEWVDASTLARVFVTRRDIVWIARELMRFLQVLEKAGIAHNDLRPQNVLVVLRSKTILVTDYEHSGPRFSLSNRPHRSDKLLLHPPKSTEEKAILAEQLPRLGVEFHSPYGPGCYENDYFIVNKTIFDCKNRRRYVRLVLIQTRAQLRDYLAKTQLGCWLSAFRNSRGKYHAHDDG